MTTSTSLAGLVARLAETACVRAPFKLQDGGQLDNYFDEYRLAADPTLLRDVATAMVPLVPSDAQVLAGIELGGIPLVVALSAATGLPAVFLRRRPKGYGSQHQIEGAAIDGRRTVLVDDVTRSGSQLLHMARLLRIAGGPVADALCVLERPLGGRELLAEHRVRLHALFAEADLPDPGGAATA
ncbi:orotate phosphoribosyltransferase [Kitasatospora viridis]|uniref:Orotate phosphoribosyltransferase n=1 Tax=Kitasatospora viridis TaxID=281105 RepID=A0A561TUZ7_9ACTN|nr:phosphoribosyltransferase family protein [Kitasatospora viridis]TWF90924.1 orotate phosphoribosyltransferase [Kitasatospora viridis]